MRINRAKLPPSLDGEVRFKNCPAEYRKEAEKLVEMLLKETIHSDYHTMTELDRLLVLAYWAHYDRLNLVGQPGWWNFETWFLREATWPELLRRARQWLCNEEQRIIIVNAEVEENARAAGEKWRKSIKGKRQSAGGKA